MEGNYHRKWILLVITSGDLPTNDLLTITYKYHSKQILIRCAWNIQVFQGNKLYTANSLTYNIYKCRCQNVEVINKLTDIYRSSGHTD